jgi:hypothetical protein
MNRAEHAFAECSEDTGVLCDDCQARIDRTADKERWDAFHSYLREQIR